MPDDRIDKTSFSIHNLEKNQTDLSYWICKSPQDRISAIEMLRRINYGKDISTRRLQRLLKITELIQR
jgi:hypothetical protein